MSDKESDADSFSAAMSDVKPLKPEKRVRLNSSKVSDSSSLSERRRAAVSETRNNDDPLENTDVTMLSANTVLAFQRPGVQHGVYRQLRLGKYAIDARLDLHQMTIEQARAAVYQFVLDGISHDVRCALITHGKGEGRATPALLKSHVAHWLPQIDQVLAFHSAQKHHGGTGATYIMLRKSHKKRCDNLEQHQKRH